MGKSSKSNPPLMLQGAPTSDPAPHELAAARLIMGATDKGQLTKSYFFQCLVQWFREHPLKPGFRAFDLDKGDNATLKLCHKDDPRVEEINIEEDAALDKVVKILAEADVDVSIVDGRGGSFDSIVMEWARYSDVFDLGRELGFKITLVIFPAESLEVVSQCIKVMEEVGDSADWLVVKSEKNARSFKIWEESRAAGMAKDLGAKEIKVRKLYDNMARYYTNHKVTLPQAAKRMEADILEQRRYIKEWDRITESLNSVNEILLPPAMLPPAVRGQGTGDME